jgi:hypothetical protein
MFQVDCVANQNLCMSQKVQAFPTLRFFKNSVVQPPDYRSDRTVEALVEFTKSKLSIDEQLSQMAPHELIAHQEQLEKTRDDHPGCMITGFLLVNRWVLFFLETLFSYILYIFRVPGNFHIQARSNHHNLNPILANLSHVVNNLSFGPVLSRVNIRKLEAIPNEFFDFEATQPFNGNVYLNTKIHQAFHHYIKVVSTHIVDHSILAYQMVQSSQIMQVCKAFFL